MKRIIALQGRGDSGKSTTIGILHDLLLSGGYTQVPGAFTPHGKDFIDVLTDGKRKIGITSSGDTYDLVHDRLQELITAGCQVCICACRTADRIPPGTIAAVNSFSGYSPEFVQKTYAQNPNQEPSINASDANNVFNEI
jgi:hypothetical protein